MSSAEVPGRLHDALRTADRGVVVLAVDGLSADLAQDTWTSASIDTVPRVSATITEVATVLENHSGTVLGRELDLPDLPGCTVVPAPARQKLDAQAEDPPLLVANVVADLEKAMPESAFLWTYVNLAGHDDEPAREAMLRLDAHAARWAASGWTVVAYAGSDSAPHVPHATWRARSCHVD